MKTTDREVASCRKGRMRRRNVYAKAIVFKDSSGHWLTYLNQDREIVVDPNSARARCEKCGWGYAELVNAKTCVCGECRGEELVEWGMWVQEWADVDLGWRIAGGSELEDARTAAKRRMSAKAARTRAADLKNVRAKP